MGKPLAIRVASDDCAVTSAGEVYYPHEGEWIELFPGVSPAFIREIDRFRRMAVDLDAAEGEADEADRSIEATSAGLVNLCTALAAQIVAWNWTDNRNRELPQPADAPEVLMALDSQEVLYLVTAVRGDNLATRKNGSRPLATTSSATGSAPTVAKRSAGGRSRTKQS